MILKAVKKTEITFSSWLLLFTSKLRLQNKELPPKKEKNVFSRSLIIKNFNTVLSMENNLPQTFYPHELHEPHDNTRIQFNST